MNVNITDKYIVLHKVSFRDVEHYYFDRLEAHEAWDSLKDIDHHHAKQEQLRIHGNFIKFLENNGYKVEKVEDK